MSIVYGLGPGRVVLFLNVSNPSILPVHANLQRLGLFIIWRPSPKRVTLLHYVFLASIFELVFQRATMRRRCRAVDGVGFQGGIHTHRLIELIG